MAKAKAKHLKLVHSSDKTVHNSIIPGTDLQDLKQYINFGGTVRSHLGTMVQRKEDGTTEVVLYVDPENGMIEALDSERALRKVHQAMVAIGTHARVLVQAYLDHPKIPPCIRKNFGDVSGIVGERTSNLESLLHDCDLIDRGDAELKRAAKRRVSSLRSSAHELLGAAEAAYMAALTTAKRDERPKDFRLFVEPLPHVCRVGSPIHSCPCKW